MYLRVGGHLRVTKARASRERKARPKILVYIYMDHELNGFYNVEGPRVA